MKMYLDKDFRCHAAPGDGLREAETGFFDGKCTEFMEGYRFVPAGESWTREDGALLTGEMVTPVRDYDTLAEIQTAVARNRQAADEVLAAVIEEVYALDAEMMGV